MAGDRTAAAIALAIAAAVTAAGVAQNTWAAGGSDSSCFALMAEAFAGGRVQPASPLAIDAPWPQASLTLAPGGFIPSPVRAEAASPVCAPGFALALAPFRALGGRDALFVVTPLAGALLVWWSFVVARALAGAVAGVAAALLVAATPVLLFQVVQPMNDVLTAALWMGVLAAATLDDRRRWWVMGAGVGVALLVRPNLAPVAIAVGVWTLRSERPWANACALTLAAAPGIAVMLALNAAVYGHPLRAGYGAVDTLFAVSHVVPNLQHYGRALIETELALPLVGLAAPLCLAGARRRLAWLGLAIAAAVLAVYLLYRPFPEWWYLRFLLPALAPLTVLCAVVLARVTRHPAAFMVLAALLAAGGVLVAHERQAFDLDRLEARFWRTGEVVRDRLPANTVAITVWQSGSVRYHAGREAVLWDSLDPAWLDRAVAWLRARGHDPVIVVEQWEEPLFRERFAAQSPIGQLDWPPRFDIDRQVRIYHPADRAAYLDGATVPTEYIRRRE